MSWNHLSHRTKKERNTINPQKPKRKQKQTDAHSETKLSWTLQKCHCPDTDIFVIWITIIDKETWQINSMCYLWLLDLKKVIKNITMQWEKFKYRLYIRLTILNKC